MKVYRIKHKSSGKYVSGKRLDRIGKIYYTKGKYYNLLKNNPDYEILYDEIKD